VRSGRVMFCTNIYACSFVRTQRHRYHLNRDNKSHVAPVRCRMHAPRCSSSSGIYNVSLIYYFISPGTLSYIYVVPSSRAAAAAAARG